MKLDVKVKNLGKIKEAEFHIRPITVITGPNGTGKSFFTKSLYSILNVVNKNFYPKYLSETIQETQGLLDHFFRTIKLDFDGSLIPSTIEPEHITDLYNSLDTLKKELTQENNFRSTEYFKFLKTKLEAVKQVKKNYNNYLSRIKSMADVSFENNSEINDFFDKLISQIEEPIKYYPDYLIQPIKNELQDNFQISNLDDLISFQEKIIRIDINELIKIEVINNEVISNLGSNFSDTFFNLSSVVFVESPAYWKVRDALKSAKYNPNRALSPKTRDEDFLTGVPKYFYDLDSILNIRTKTECFFKSALDLLGKAIGGELIFKNDNFSFIDQDGHEISKQLISFGMTNLGMLQALLRYNLITEGSFIFIDEPEANLHPDWQVKLVDVLLILAKSGVNVIITTHSSDLMKALEVKIKKLQVESMEDFLSVHFLDIDGKLLKFESKDKHQQLIEARNLLSLAYQTLYFSDL